jgi:hypothetical protein
MSLEAQIGRIVAKLAAARGLADDPFELDPPLAEDDVRAFERLHGVELPADFRAFVRAVGSGGAGPHEGLFPLAHWLYGESKEPRDLHHPFPLSEASRDEDVGALLERGADPCAGAITIGAQGDGILTLLVVSGEARGRVVYVAAVDEAAPLFVEPPGFLGWYERWLDELLAGHRTDSFGYEMPGMEDDLARVLAGAGSRDRVRALHAMRRLPALAPSTSALVVAATRADDVEVRTVAQALAKARGLVSAPSSPSAVRIAQLRAMAKDDPERHAAARRVLDDPDRDLVVAALAMLEGALAEDELVALLSSDRDEKIMFAALRSARHLVSERVAVLLGALVSRFDKPIVWDALDRLIAQGVAPADVRATALARGSGGGVGELLRIRAVVRASNATDEERAAAVTALLDAAGSPDAFTRYDAACGLGTLAHEADTQRFVCRTDVIEALEALATDETKPSRRSGQAIISTDDTIGHRARRALQPLRT